MALAQINTCIVIPNLPNWESDIQWVKDTPSSIVQTIQGQEERLKVRKNPLIAFVYKVTPATLQERALLDERIQAAIKSGRAAVPYWGRGQELASDCSTTTLTLTADSQWQFATGDYVFFWDSTTEVWETIEVASAVGVNVVLGSSPSQTFSARSLCWPIKFGQVLSNFLKGQESWRADVSITFREPLGSGSLIDSSVSCPAIPNDFNLPSVDFCEGGLVLSSTALDACGGGYTISWTKHSFADSYLLKVSNTQGGPYTTVGSFDPDELSTTRSRPYLTDRYYVVYGVIGDFTTDASNEVLVPGRKIESAMRAIQERRESVNESAFSWPARVLPSAAATPDYPVDDWYADDIASGGPSKEVSLLQEVFDAIDDATLGNYTSGVEGLNYDDTIVTYYRGLSGTPFATLPLTVTTGNVESSMALVETICCSLQYITQLALYSLVESNNGVGGDGTSPPDGNNGTPTEALAWAIFDYNAGSFVDITGSLGSANPGVHGSVLSSPPVSPPGPRTWSSNMETTRFKLDGTWTGYGSLGRLYLMLATLPGPGPTDPPFVVVSANNPPVDTTGKFLKATQYTMPQGYLETDYFANATPINPDQDSTFGWYLVGARWLLEKSPLPSDGEWSYFP